jgi:molybdopterin converting factor small subunit
LVTVVLSRAWAQHGQTKFVANAGPLTDVIKQLAASEPDYHRRLLDSDGEPYRYLSIFVDDEQVPRYQQATVNVADGCTVTIVPPLAGG